MNLDKIIKLSSKLEKEISVADILDFCNELYKAPMKALNNKVAKEVESVVASAYYSQHNELFQGEYYIKVEGCIDDSEEVSYESKWNKINDEQVISLTGTKVIEIQENSEFTGKNINEGYSIKLIRVEPIDSMRIFNIESIIDGQDFNGYINAKRNNMGNNKEYLLYDYIIQCARECGANSIRCAKSNGRFYNYYVFADEVTDFFEYSGAIEVNVKNIG